MGLNFNSLHFVIRTFNIVAKFSKYLVRNILLEDTTFLKPYLAVSSYRAWNPSLFALSSFSLSVPLHLVAGLCL